MLNISVVIPAFNAAATIGTAIESATVQSPREIIVVDDGSRDGTAAIARAFRGATVLTIPNSGPAAARNAGIEIAKGEWIALLDADDWWLPGKLVRQMEKATHGVGLIATLSDRTRGDICPPLVKLDDLWRSNLLVTSSVLLRREAWNKIGGFVQDRRLTGAEDYNMWIRLAAAGWEIRCVQEVLTHYTLYTGISMNLRGVLRGLLYNLYLLERDGCPLDVQKKRVAILDRFARCALRARDMRLAREAAFKAHLLDPSFPRLAILGAALLPSRAIDTAAGWRRLRARRLISAKAR